MGYPPGPTRGAAGALQPQASRARAWAAVPVLSRHGREIELRRHSADQDLHELPRADLDQRRSCWSRCATAGPAANRLVWTKVHDLPDFVYFSHYIHVNKGMGCASCHGRVDQMPLMYAQNTLQMEWCLNCHRNPAKNLRPTSEIYQHGLGKPATMHRSGVPISRRLPALRPRNS